MELDIKQIMERLPHRYPMLLVDRVLEMVPGKSIVAIKKSHKQSASHSAFSIEC